MAPGTAVLIVHRRGLLLGTLTQLYLADGVGNNRVLHVVDVGEVERDLLGEGEGLHGEQLEAHTLVLHSGQYNVTPTEHSESPVETTMLVCDTLYCIMVWSDLLLILLLLLLLRVSSDFDTEHVLLLNRIHEHAIIVRALHLMILMQLQS